MFSKDDIKILIKDINVFNDTVPKVIEEMSELTKVLVKHFYRNRERRDEIIEEMGDVYIVMEELKVLMKIDDSDIKKTINKKLQRQIKRIGENKSKK